MTELSKDARALVARVKHRDGPTPADRERLRSKLDPAWAAQRAELLPAAAELAPPRHAAGWTSWASGLLLLSIGFVAPEAPQTREPLPLATSAPLMAAASVTPAPQPTAAEPASQPVAHELAPVEAAPQPHAMPRANARRPQRPLSMHANTAPPPSAREIDAKPLAAAPAPAPTSAVTANEPERPVAALSDAPAESRYVTRTEAPAASGGELTPTLRNHAFAPQPIDDELTWLSAAQEALAKNQPSSALRLVQEHAFRYPQGALAVERTAVHALALCALSRKAAAREVVADLAHRAPHSPLLARVRRNCGF